MGNCVFANVIWGWRIFTPGDFEQRDPLVLEFVEKRGQFRQLLKDWDTAEETKERSLQVNSEDLWPEGYADLSDITDLDDYPDDFELLSSDAKLLLHRIVVMCLELQKLERQVIASFAASKQLEQFGVDSLHLFVVGDDGEPYAGSGCEEGEIILGVGLYAIHWIWQQNRRLAEAMAEAKADYFQWVT